MAAAPACCCCPVALLMSPRAAPLPACLSCPQAPKPSAGPHKTRECLPLILLLRNRLKYALTGKEVTSILMQRLVEVDGKIRTDKTYPVGFMDVVDIPKTGACRECGGGVGSVVRWGAWKWVLLCCCMRACVRELSLPLLLCARRLEVEQTSGASWSDAASL